MKSNRLYLNLEAICLWGALVFHGTVAQVPLTIVAIIFSLIDFYHLITKVKDDATTSS